MNNIALTRKFFNFMGANVSNPEKIKDYLIHEIKSTKGYKEYQYFDGKPLFDVDELKDMSIVELFEAYSAIKLIPEALELLYEKIMYGDLEYLHEINKPNFYEEEGLKLFIKNLNAVKSSKVKNTTNIKREEMIKYFDENTLSSLDDIPPSNPKKLKEFNESSVKGLIKSNKLYCIGEQQYNAYIERSKNEYISYLNKKNSKKIKLFYCLKLTIAILISIKVCNYYYENYNDIGYFLTMAVYPPLFMGCIGSLTDYGLDEIFQPEAGLIFQCIAGVALCLTWLISNFVHNGWHTFGFIVYLVGVSIAFCIYMVVAYGVYFIAAIILELTVWPIARRLGIMPYKINRNTDNSNQQSNNSLY